MARHRYHRRQRRSKWAAQTAIPLTFKIKHRYVSGMSITQAGNFVEFHSFRANGIFDPDQSGIGHQPMYTDEVANMGYSEYFVLRSRITVSPQTVSASPAPPVMAGCILANMTINSGNIAPDAGGNQTQAILEYTERNPGSIKQLVWGPSNFVATQGTERTKIVCTYDAKRENQVSKMSDLYQNSGWVGAATATGGSPGPTSDPTFQWYFNVWQGCLYANTVTYHYLVEIEYQVLWFKVGAQIIRQS